MSEPSPRVSMNERKHQFVQMQLREAALELFVEKGFDSTTVDEIAEAAGISRRTFFRYYETKEDVIVAALAAGGEDLLQCIREQPEDEQLLETMDASLQAYLSNYQQNNPRAWSILNLIQSTPRLRARFVYERDQWLPQIADTLASRAVSRSHATVAAAVGLGILTVIYDQWHQNPDIDVARATHQAFQQLHELPRADSD